MDWIFSHLWILVVIATIVVQVMKAVRGHAGSPADGTEPPAKEFEFGDPELAERTRKIREDIRRKIEERRGQLTPPVVPGAAPPLARGDRSPEATPPPVVIQLPEIIREVFEPKPSEPPAPPATRAEQMREAEEAERQAALMGQVREAEQMKAAAARRAAFEAETADQEATLRQQTHTAVLADLRDPAALRRAFVLREVLGPPLALR